jgi:hypothetical protein
MLLCDAPVAIDLAQAHSQSEQKTVLVYGTAGPVLFNSLAMSAFPGREA